MMNESLSTQILERLQKKDKKISKLLDEHDIQTILHELDVYHAELLAQNEELLEKEQQLKESNIEYQMLFNSAPNSYILIDEKFEIMLFNTNADIYFNITNSRLKRKYLLTYIKQEFIKEFINWFDKKTYIKEPLSLQMNCKDGVKRFKIKANTYPKNKEWVLLSLTDIENEYQLIETIKKLNEEKLKQQQILYNQSKNNALSELVVNIAHHWRQPLSLISTKVTSLQVYLELGREITKDEIIECAKDVTDSCNYLSNTITDISEYFNSDTEKIEEINLKELLDKIYSLMKDPFKANSINFITNTEEIYMKNNKNLLSHAILNICHNTYDAILLNSINEEKRYLFIDLIKKDNYAIFTIKDSALGIDEKIIDKIFEPYFTTKFKSKGTGLGLYMTYQIITQNFNGKIEVKNSNYTYEGKDLKGVEFTITLPI